MSENLPHIEKRESSTREKSAIAFPYLDLETAIEVAKAVYNRGGLSACDLDELAAEMKQTMSGAFRLKTGTAKTFDLVEKEGKGGIKLTQLGRDIVLPSTERAGRVEAFLRVPLYSAIYEKYKGHLLPPPKALEKEMQGLGVSSKQTDKARQAFERSARQAGFFEAGEDRLVKPRAELPNRTESSQSEPLSEGKGVDLSEKDNKSRGNQDYHPFVQGLLDELPKTDEFVNWSIDDQAEWLSAAAGIFKLLSKSKGKIIVTVQTQKNLVADQ